MAPSRPPMRGIRPPRVFPRGRSSPYAVELTALLLVLGALGIFSLPVPFLGSAGGDKPSGASERHHGPSDRSAAELSGGGLGERGPQWTEAISWEPRAFIFHNFLSEEECEYLIEVAKPHMAKSTVIDRTTGERIEDRWLRTCSVTSLRRGQDEIIRTIEKRIADYTFIPVEHGEGLQILHYEVGQKYDCHFDCFHDEFNTRNGGQRMATIIMYLSDVEEGGETFFPDAKVNGSSLPWNCNLSECGKRALSVKPKMGDALLFWSIKPDATLDPLSLHAGCPVITGNKWSSTKWMRTHEYRERSYQAGNELLGSCDFSFFQKDASANSTDNTHAVPLPTEDIYPTSITRAY